jgi:hypothetical protein
MTDKRWPREEGWVKMAQYINGAEIHSVRNTKSAQVDDFKFKLVSINVSFMQFNVRKKITR